MMMPVTLYRKIPPEDEMIPGSEKWWAETIARRRLAFAHAHLVWQWRDAGYNDIPTSEPVERWARLLEDEGRL